MRILITNNTLAARGGSELYALDVATRLKRRGHKVVAYSSILGAISEEMRSLGVPVIGDLNALTETPDVIHGQHHLDAAAAGLRFPDVPVVHVCHGWLPWQEAPLGLASVRRYVAVSELTREYLVTSGVNPKRIALIPNFVDLERFAMRRRAGAPMKRALAYGNGWFPEAPELNFIREACHRRGLEFEVVGNGMGNKTDRPQELLPSFDIVFALGRSALEAMACGCAVIVADPKGFGGPVTTQSFHRQRSANFGLALIAGNPVTQETVEAALRELDVEDAARVSEFVLEQAGIDKAVDQWEEQYQLAIAEGPADLADTIAKASNYLVKLKDAIGHFETNWHHANAQIQQLEQQLVQVRSHSQALASDNEMTELAQAQERQAAHASRQQYEERLNAIETMNRELSVQINGVRRELTTANSHLNALIKSRSWRVTRPLRAMRRRFFS